jgi:hypothetical protein
MYLSCFPNVWYSGHLVGCGDEEEETSKLGQSLVLVSFLLL